MNAWQKITVGVLATIAWIASLWIGYLYPSLASSMAEIKMTAQGILGGLGLYHLMDSPGASVPNIPPQAPDSGPVITEQHQRDSTLTGSQGGFARVSMLISMAVVSVFLLAACATNCGSDQHCAKEDAENIGVGIGAALDILAIPAEVDQTTTTTTSTCTKDRRGDSQCITTKQSY